MAPKWFDHWTTRAGRIIRVPACQDHMHITTKTQPRYKRHDPIMKVSVHFTVSGKRFSTDHFSGPGRAIIRVCVSLCLGNRMTTDLDT